MIRLFGTLTRWFLLRSLRHFLPPMNPPSLDILYEDNHLLVLNKPAGLPTMGTPGGRPTLLTLAKEDVKRRYQKPGNVYLGVMSRLDAPVTGVVLLARTSKAAARLTRQFLSRTVEKSYWAVVEGVLSRRPAVSWTGWATTIGIVACTSSARLCLARGPAQLPAAGAGSTTASGRANPAEPEAAVPHNSRRRPCHVVGGRAGDRAKTPDSPAIGPSWPSDHRRSEIWQS